jgi:hypothetical protein
MKLLPLSCYMLSNGSLMPLEKPCHYMFFNLSSKAFIVVPDLIEQEVSLSFVLLEY